MKTSLLLSIAACTVLAIGVAPAASAQEKDVKNPPIVITIGAHTTKIGFAGERAPLVTIPTMVGTPKDNCVIVGMGQGKDRYFGDELLAKRGCLDLSPLFRRGQFFASTDNVVNFFHYIFYNELRVAPEEHNVLIAMADVVEVGPTRILVNMLFEDLNVKAVYVASLAQLGLLASGRTTGLAVHMTHEGGHIVPVVEGEVMASSVVALPVGLDRQAEYMRQLLLQRNYNISDKFVLEDIVGSTTYIAADYDAELQKGPSTDVVYQMADGTSLTLDSERFLVPETLFQPTLAHMMACGLAECIENSVHPRVARAMLNNVVLLGAGSMTPGLVPRLESELKSLFPSLPVRIVAPMEREAAVWVGGSILVSISTFPSHWISRAEFDEGKWWDRLSQGGSYGLPKD